MARTAAQTWCRRFRGSKKIIELVDPPPVSQSEKTNVLDRNARRMNHILGAKPPQTVQVTQRPRRVSNSTRSTNLVTHVATPTYSSSISDGDEDWQVEVAASTAASEVGAGNGDGTRGAPTRESGDGTTPTPDIAGKAPLKQRGRVTIGNILRGEHERAWMPSSTSSSATSSLVNQHASGVKSTNVTSAFKLVKEARSCAKAERIEIPTNIEDEYLLNMKPVISADASQNSNNSAPSQERSSSIKPVLDWLYVSQGRLTPMQMADLSSNMALSRIHVIDVGSMNTFKEAIADGVLWMGANRLPSAPVRVAAYLNRLKHRFRQRFNDGKSIVIMTYSSSASYLTLHALALFLYMYCYMDHTDSRNLAAAAVEKQIPPVSILESGIEELAACGKGWLERVQIEWPYGANSAVDICGEICGGWHVTRHLYYHASRKTWRIQLWGLPPGSYSFKYVNTVSMF